jgi:uncharacterized lipoprotein YbaY
MSTENTIITLYRRELMARATSGVFTGAIPRITQIAFGSGGTNAGGEPIPPNISASALNNEVARYSIDAPPTFPNTTTPRYRVTIPQNDLASVRINEAALVDATGALCAIKTMYDKRKDSGVSFTFDFDDEF